jgi:hypothetical protein
MPESKRRELARRARRLGRCDLLPGWLASPPPPSPPTPQPAPTTPPPPPLDDTAERIIDAKARVHGIPASVLRMVYSRELVSNPTTLSPPSPQNCAHARVNSFIRLSQGDPDARSDDADLLAFLIR